jgi:hypothetical protein
MLSENTGSVGLDMSLLDNFEKKKKIRIDADNLRFTIDGTEYTWEGGFGAVFSSKEAGVMPQSVRSIGNLLFVAHIYDERKHWFTGKQRISWTTPNLTVEEIREIKKEIFR